MHVVNVVLRVAADDGPRASSTTTADCRCRARVQLSALVFVHLSTDMMIMIDRSRLHASVQMKAKRARRFESNRVELLLLHLLHPPPVSRRPSDKRNDDDRRLPFCARVFESACRTAEQSRDRACARVKRRASSTEHRAAKLSVNWNRVQWAQWTRCDAHSTTPELRLGLRREPAICIIWC